MTIHMERMAKIIIILAVVCCAVLCTRTISHADNSSSPMSLKKGVALLEIYIPDKKNIETIPQYPIIKKAYRGKLTVDPTDNIWGKSLLKMRHNEPIAVKVKWVFIPDQNGIYSFGISLFDNTKDDKWNTGYFGKLSIEGGKGVKELFTLRKQLRKSSKFPITEMQALKLAEGGEYVFEALIAVNQLKRMKAVITYSGPGSIDIAPLDTSLTAWYTNKKVAPAPAKKQGSSNVIAVDPKSNKK